MPAAVKAEETQDASSFLQRESRRFATLYERNAYVAYNLALRITCEPSKAMAAAERAFLLQLGQEASEARLILGVVSTAREEAPERPRPNGAGDAEASRLLAATATLPLPERIILGLISVGHGAPAMVAAAMTLPEGKSEELRDHAQASLAAALKVDRAEAEAMSASWPWAQPPPELWESTYAKAYRALENGIAQPGSNGTAAPAVIVARNSQDGPAAPVARRRPAWLGRRAILAAAVIVPAVIAAAAAFGGGGSSDPASLGLAAPTGGAVAPATGDAKAGEPGAKPYEALTPEELDKLRLNELQALRRYSQEQQNKSLSLDKRRKAADHASVLAERARNRLRAERADRARRKAAAERRRNHQNSTHKARPPRRPSHTAPAAPKSSPPPSKPKAQDPKQSECLYDEKNGSYICPT
jgi:hypothetical protein